MNPVGGKKERRSARLEEIHKQTLPRENPSTREDSRAETSTEVEDEFVVFASTEVAEGAEPITPARQQPEIEEAPEEDQPEEDPVEEEDLNTSSEEDVTMAPSTRLKYGRFKGDGSQDVDDWFGEFESTAFANQEREDAKQRIFQGLLKGEALKWYQDVAEEVKEDWDQLTTLFLHTFREVGGEARALGRLSKMGMKSGESVRAYGQRVKSLIQKLTTEIAPSVQVEWYVAGFPEEMGFQIRQSRPTTLREAMEAAQNYENSAQSLRRSIKRSEAKERNTSKKHKKKERRRRKYSDSSSSSSDGTASSSSSSSSEESGEETSSKKQADKTRNKADRGKEAVRVKKEQEDSKKFMKSIQESLEAIRVNLAENRKPRRIVPTSRANVWCPRCGEQGHFANECTRGVPRRIHYVDQEEDVYYTLPEEEEEETNPVFQVQSSYGRGRLPPQPLRTHVIQRGHQAGPSQGMIPISRDSGKPIGFCFICGSPDHYANMCPYRGPGQGAPMVLPCQNCGEYGHALPSCPKPQQSRIPYKQVEVPPREQTGLNYAHKAGVENPDK